MALRGNLKDFSLPDVFQLVTFSKKTGVLRIRRADGTEGSVWFRDGDVFFAQSNWHREPLGERMVAAQRITAAALERALGLRRGEGTAGRRLGQILVDEGYVSEKVLEVFVQEQIQDTIFDLMRWDEGDFDFETMPEVVDEDIGLSVSIENIVMEGARRLEEWTRIKKKVPSMDIVFKMATAPGEGTFEISLKPVEWQLLLLIDGTRSVSQLAEDTDRTDFDVARIIYGLFSAGLLEVASDDEVEKMRAERAVRDQKLAAIRRETELTRRSKAARPVAETGVEPEAHEEPEFLAGSPGAPTAEDMAVFEQMMGAVLESPQPAPVAPEPAQESEPAPEPEPEVEPAPEPEPEVEPAPEPEPEEEAFMAVPEAPFEVSEALPVEVEAEAGVLEPEAEPAPAEAQVEDESLSGLLEILGDEATAEPEAVVAEEPEAAAGGEPEAETGDLERDLMALGLGELPSEDLLLPTEPASIVPPDAEATPGELPADAELGEPLDAGEGVAAGIPEHELLALRAALGEEGAEPSTPGAEVETHAAEEGEPEAEADFGDLLSSLEGPEPATEGLISTEPYDDTGPEAAGTTGVISTDAFLDEIGGMELGTGIGDELTALTGGGGGRQRPVASVKRIPERAEGAGLRMDRTVDRELVLKIIDGIKNL